jgi:LysM repeat protein
MNKEEPYRDQAERLRQKVENTKYDSNIKEKLPSRSDIHRNKKNKTKWKLKYPVIRLLVLFFTLLPIAIFSAYSTLSDNKLLNSEKVDSEQTGYEEVNFEEKENSEETESNDSESVTEDSEDKDSKLELETINKQTEQKSNLSQGNDSLPSTDKDQTTSNDQEEVSEKLVYHTVQSNETLFRIAMKYYNTQSGINIIKQANKMHGNEIQAGQVLKIPK